MEAECVLSSEIDKRAVETYRLNFGEEPMGDVRKITDIPDFDFLLAGFPCQPFSYAGKQKGFADTRGTLFFEIERILKNKKPRAFLLENVRGLTTHDGGKTFGTILSKLGDLGYGVSYVVLNSSAFGVPQNRVRVYILGLLGAKPELSLRDNLGYSDSHKFKRMLSDASLFGGKPFKTVKDVLEKNVDEKYYCSKEFVDSLSRTVDGDLKKLNGTRLIDYRNGASVHSWEIGLKGVCTKDEVDFMNALIANRRKKKFGVHQDGKRLSIVQIKTFYKNKKIKSVIKSLCEKGYLKEVKGKYNPVAGNMSFEIFKILDPDSISVTLVSSDSDKLGVVAGNRIRRLTPRECARIQGFEDGFVCHPADVHAYKQFGNSVSVPVVEEVIADFLKNNYLKVGRTKEKKNLPVLA
jgi:DNA (cytosine-5)-methyltransferase 1